MRVMHAAIAVLEGKPFKSIQKNSFPDRTFRYHVAKMIGGCSSDDVMDWAIGRRKYIGVYESEARAIQQKIKKQIKVVEGKRFRNVICRHDNVLYKKDTKEEIRLKSEWLDELKRRHLIECARKFDKEQAEIEAQYTKEGKKLDRLVTKKYQCIVLDFIRYAKLADSILQSYYEDSIDHETYPKYLDWFVTTTQTERENIMVKYVLGHIDSEPFSSIKNKLEFSR